MARGLPNLRRKLGHRKPRRRIVVFTEGAVTEPTYFLELGCSLGNVLISIQPNHGVPETLLKQAKQYIRDENRRFDSATKTDSIWLVFDRDEHPNVGLVLEQARSKQINVAYSNPCFELWLLIHLVDHDAYDNRVEVQKKLEDACPSYRRDRKFFKFNALAPYLSDAKNRAIKMISRRVDEGNPGGNPYTDVHLLLSAIEEMRGEA